ncbi:unnamed protein product [Xylocopa violacea]|uniref:Uncharacterized protein n=1 Tax=Xylocopa violacea TaxID=135666 RepID=A0ABP1NXN3_XYLVO
MLNVVAPGKLVLTLQSIPPFVVESIFALTLAVLLALPLLLRAQRCLDTPMKPTARTKPTRGSNVHKLDGSEERVVTHYPASTFDSASSSSADLLLETARRTISTPILQASGDNVRVPRRKPNAQASIQEVHEKALKQSSSFIATNSELPIVDISAFDYDVYRYKLVEAALRKQYDDYQPPGDVVLNSIHLNNDDSTVAVRLNDGYHHSLFNFVEEYYDATKGMSKRETEYLHPLDHFLVKGTQRRETVERETETKRVDLIDAAAQNEKSPRISFYDDTLLAGQRRQDSIVKKSSRSPRARPSSASADSTASKVSAFQRSSNKKSATKFSRTNSSTDSVSSKRDALFGSNRRENKRESSIDGAERESINCTTISSIDSESVRSESSKPRDDRSCHSPDSSVTSKRGAAEKPEVQPWLSGNPRVSFNRKYGTADQTSAKIFEAYRRSSVTRKSSVLSRGQASKQSVRPISEYARTAANESLTNENSARDVSKLSPAIRTDDAKSSNPLSKLEAIKSETEEFQKADPRSIAATSIKNLANESLEQPRRSSSKHSSETSPPRVQVPETIDSPVGIARQPPAEPRLTHPRSKRATREPENTDERSSKLSTKQCQPEKLGKVSRHDRRQRSRTVSPVLGNQPVPKTELCAETFPTEEEFREPAAVDSRQAKNVEKRREAREAEDWKIKTAKEDAKKRPENDPRGGTSAGSPRSNAHGGKPGRDSSSRNKENREDERSDFNRRFTGSNVRNFGSTSTGKSNGPVVGKLSSASRGAQQRAATGTRLNAGLHDNVIGARSMQIRSSKSPVSERKPSRGGKPEKPESSRLGLKDNAADDLELPRRDSKVGVAMQAGLKKYIKKLKRVLSDRDNADIGELASLSLTDAILPELESTLSSVEVQQVQNVLNMAEKKSDLMQTRVSGFKRTVP